MRALFGAAVCSGVLAGLLVTLLQTFTVVPLIVKAEAYEPGALASHHADDGVPHAGDDAHEPGVHSRFSTRLIINLTIGIGFALLLTGFMAALRRTGWRTGVLFGLSGFVAFVLAPAQGLPPELPGVPTAALGARQVWWLSTALATALALALIGLTRHPALALAGIGLLVLPHIFAAPVAPILQPMEPELASLVRVFNSASLVTNMLFWAALGGCAGALHQRFTSSGA